MCAVDPWKHILHLNNKRSSQTFSKVNKVCSLEVVTSQLSQSQNTPLSLLTSSFSLSLSLRSQPATSTRVLLTSYSPRGAKSTFFPWIRISFAAANTSVYSVQFKGKLNRRQELTQREDTRRITPKIKDGTLMAVWIYNYYDFSQCCFHNSSL